MLIKAGVDISRLRPEIRKQLNVIRDIYLEEVGEEIVITSTYEGNHSPGSLHYANLAIDIRAAVVNINLKNRLTKILGNNYDVVSELDHIHIEYDPKKT